MRYLLIAVAVFFSIINASHAQDAGLYDPAVNPEAAFVRFINLNSHASKPFKLQGKETGLAGFGQATPYHPTEAGAVKAASGNNHLEIEAKRQNFYTIVDTPGKLVLIKDKPVTGTKAQIGISNFSLQSALTLKTIDGATAIAGPVEPGGNAIRDINPVNVAMAIYQGDKKIKEVGEKVMARGIAYLVLIYEGADNELQVSYIEAAIDTRR